MSEVEEPFEQLLANLKSEDSPLRAAVVYRMSEASSDDLEQLKAHWEEIPLERKRILVTRMAESSEANYELDFSDVAQFTLRDADPEVRAHSISALWTSESPEIMYALIELLLHDPDTSVRAAAAEGLGQYVLLGELGHLPSSVSGDAESQLLATINHEAAGSEVYCRALESLSFSSHHEITDLIGLLTKREEPALRASTMLAMGRNGDTQWQPRVLRGLSDDDPSVKFEAVRAAGEMSLTEAVTDLIEIAKDPEDREIQEMAIWSLGEIGGEEAQGALFSLAEEATDDTLRESIEDALNIAALSLGDFGTYMMAPDDDDDDLMLEDLEGLDGDDIDEQELP